MVFSWAGRAGTKKRFSRKDAKKNKNGVDVLRVFAREFFSQIAKIN
jgi:hypothetical protein